MIYKLIAKDSGQEIGRIDHSHDVGEVVEYFRKFNLGEIVPVPVFHREEYQDVASMG